MPAPTRHDAFTGLVFVVAGALSLVIAVIAVELSSRILGIDDGSAVLEAVIAFGGGMWAAARYRKNGGDK